MPIPENLKLKNCMYLFTKHIWQHILSLLALFNVPIYEACRKLGKMYKNFENWKISRFFAIFGVNLSQFLIQKTAISSS